MPVYFSTKFRGEVVPYTKIQKLTCPRCKKEAPFMRMRGRLFFHINLIPLFPIEMKEAEVLQCGNCKEDFSLPDGWDFDAERKQMTVIEDYAKLLIKDRR